MQMTFFIDGDNHMNEGIKGIELLSAEDKVIIFHARNMVLENVKKKTSQSKAQIEFVENIYTEKNAIDFQIIAELGFLIGQNQLEYAYVISQDKGFQAAVMRLKKLKKSQSSALLKEIQLKSSIQECLELGFILRAETTVKLSNVLQKEYGEHGITIYRHLRKIFENTVVEE